MRRAIEPTGARYRFEVLAEGSGLRLAEGNGYLTEAQAQQAGHLYAIQYAIGGEPCVLKVSRMRVRNRGGKA